MRSLQRVAGLLVVSGLLLVAGEPHAGGTAGPAAGDAARRAAEYLAARQQPDGAFFSASATADSTAEALVAMLAGGLGGEPADRALRFIRARGPARAKERAAYAGRLVMGLAASGEDPRRFGGFDYVAALESFYDARTGAYDSANLYADAIAALGVLAAGERLPDQAITYLRLGQCADGGVGWQPGCTGKSDLDTTSLAVSVLVGAKVPASDVTRSRARSFLAGAENAEGGFGQYAGGATNANSTGLALSAIAALGEGPSEPPWRQADGDNPIRALVALQQRSGGFRYIASQDEVNDYATVQAIPGLAGLPYPVHPPERRPPEEAGIAGSRGGAGATDGSGEEDRATRLGPRATQTPNPTGAPTGPDAEPLERESGSASGPRPGGASRKPALPALPVAAGAVVAGVVGALGARAQRSRERRRRDRASG